MLPQTDSPTINSLNLTHNIVIAVSWRLWRSGVEGVKEVVLQEESATILCHYIVQGWRLFLMFTHSPTIKSLNPTQNIVIAVLWRLWRSGVEGVSCTGSLIVSVYSIGMEASTLIRLTLLRLPI